MIKHKRAIRKFTYFMKHRLTRNNYRKMHGRPMLRMVQRRKAQRQRKGVKNDIHN